MGSAAKRRARRKFLRTNGNPYLFRCVIFYRTLTQGTHIVAVTPGRRRHLVENGEGVIWMTPRVDPTFFNDHGLARVMLKLVLQYPEIVIKDVLARKGSYYLKRN